VDVALKRWPKYGHLPAIALLIVLTLGLCVTVVRADSGTIIVSGNPPQVANLYIADYPTPGANVTHIAVDTKYTIMLNATDPDLLTDIRKIDVQLYTNSFNDTGNIKHHYSFKWTYDGVPHFANVGPSGSYFDIANSTEPTLANSKGVFQLVFKLDKLAIYTKVGESSLHWTVKAYIYDNANNVSWLDNTFDVDLYQSLTIDSSVTWSSLVQGSTWNLGSPGPGTWTYTSNAIAKIQIHATTPTNGYGNTIPVGNVQVALNSGHTTNLQAFTGTAADWLTGLSNDAAQEKTVYWFVDIPAGQPTGTYTFTYYATIAFDSYAT
jgi:hypothetical protein